MQQSDEGTPVAELELRAPNSAITDGDALAFLADLHREFGGERERLLQRRTERAQAISAGERPDFLSSTAAVRSSDWCIEAVPPPLRDRRVEITGPVDAKMMINALNSGASVFMADFEDATTPTWSNLVQGQQNLVESYRRTLTFESGDKSYRLGDDLATLIVRPRGWHLPEKHLVIDGRPASGSLFDFGLYAFHGGQAALAAGLGPYLYLPKLENHLEARLWNDVFTYTEDRLAWDRGSIRATVLIETILAAFEMDEILYELRDHAAGLNAGRWDYIFSMIKTFRADPGFVLPDRSQVGMTVPFMRSYTELQVATCHRRGAHAIGGMAAFIPNRRNPEVTETALAKVTEDKRREAAQGYDGTWVAHPDLVPVAKAQFDAVLGDRPNQLERQRPEVVVTASDLLDTTVEGGQVTETGLRSNVSVGIRYLASWLSGQGAAGIDDLMEDVATAEISRSQIWQWVRHGVKLDDGRQITAALVRAIADEETTETADDVTTASARRIFEDVALGDDFTEFLTLPAYQLID
jgi:malate synthase